MRPISIPKHIAIWLLASNALTDKFCIVCKGYATDDDDFVEVIFDDIDNLNEDKSYDQFEIWETRK
jgi:hypothetical protein